MPQHRHEHIAALQSARGFAAWTVVISHCLNAFATHGQVVTGSSAGNAPVVFLFVLSGYVLRLSLEDKPATLQTALVFYVRRAWRLYPALWLACVLGLFCATVVMPFAHDAHLSASLARSYDGAKFDVLHIAGSFAGLSPYLVTPAWSILVSMAGSLLMPVIVFTSRKPGAMLGAFALCILCFAVPVRHFHLAMYLVDFVIGAALVDVVPRIAPFLRAWRGLPAAVLAISLMLSFWWAEPPSHLIVALDAAMIVCVILSRRWSFLEHPFLVRMGDISYSVYILHFPVMCALAILIGNTSMGGAGQMTLLLLLGTLLGTWGASQLSYELVERPGIRVGKALGNLLARRSLPGSTPRNAPSPHDRARIAS